MAKRVVDDSTLTAIADSLRECAPGPLDGYSFTPLEIPGKIAVVYDEGYMNGVAEGRQAQNDEFWDAFLQNGSRTNFDYSFAGLGWTIKNFIPNRDIKPSRAANMFQSTSNLYLDLRTLDIDIDFSNCTTLQNVFANSSITGIGTVDARNASNTTAMFNNCYCLHTIEKLILNSNGTQTIVNAFQYNTSLQTIVIEGVVGQSLDMRYSPLTKESITSVINALSATASGKTLSLKQSAVDSAFETAEGLADGSTSEEWAELVATKSNWTISLV